MFYWFIITGSSKLPQVQKLQQTRENPVIQGDLDSSRVKSHYFYKRTIPKYTVNYLPLLGTKAGSHLVKSVQEQEQSDLAFSTLELPQSGTVHRALCAQQGAHSTTVLFSQFCSPQSPPGDPHSLDVFLYSAAFFTDLNHSIASTAGHNTTSLFSDFNAA